MNNKLNHGRLIPLLTIHQNKLVKTRKFEYLKYLGDPINAVSMFGKFEVDELIVIDLTQNSSENEKLKIAQRLSSQALMPIAYGGGIKSFDFCENLFSIGFDKVVLRNKLSDQFFLEKLSDKYGKQALTGCIDVTFSETENVLKFNGIELTLEESLYHVQKLTNDFVGEIMFNFQELDGTRAGLPDNEFTNIIEQGINCPIIISGGCKTKNEALQYLSRHKKFSVAASSIFTLQPPNDAVLIKY
jgi:cyclase